jgi:predicted DNA-binding ribbon-helix-helix protein
MVKYPSEAGDDAKGVQHGRRQRDTLTAADSELMFRAVNVEGVRRGIRLEAIFWKTITAMASSRDRTLGQHIGDALDSVPENGNLSSTLRVQAAQWLRGRLLEYERATAVESIFAIVHASPAPAFILSPDKRIVQYNQAFINFIRARLIDPDSMDVMRTARLSLDMQIEQIIDLLKADPKAPVATGFAFGATERRIRGQLRLVLAPAVVTMVIAYIAEGGLRADG